MIPALTPNYNRANLAFERGEGAWLWTTDGRRFLDFGSGIATASLGHGNKHLADAIAAQLKESWARADVVITTALIPGRPAPKLVSAEMVASMRPGSVLVDLAVERGGNVEGAKAGEVVVISGVKIVGHANVPGRLAASASALYAKNLLTFLETMIDKKEKVLAVNWDDELVKATLLTRDGSVIHPNFQPKS